MLFIVIVALASTPCVTFVERMTSERGCSGLCGIKRTAGFPKFDDDAADFTIELINDPHDQ